MRDSVLFYRSFYDAMKNIPPEERLKVYDSIMEYGMYDHKPDLDGVALAIFLLAKPQIDRSIHFSEKQNGRNCSEYKLVSAKYSCGFPDPQVLPIIVESKDI